MTSMISRLTRCIPVVVTFFCASHLHAAEKMKALIVDGQNNHQVWPKSTVMMKKYLEETGMYEVSVERVRFLWNSTREKEWLAKAGAREGEEKPKAMEDPEFNPDFSKYKVVVSNFGWNAAGWPAATKKNFEKYMAEGSTYSEIIKASKEKELQDLKNRVDEFTAQARQDLQNKQQEF